ncbi:MAG TPA: radical SAM protein, partial [Spirochaetota bacterium]|nr:radical SAM protein [Spirochaetota bacterium]
MSTNTKTGILKEMTYNENEAKSILIKHKKIDSWFITHYGINLYRGCEHNCVYCDGRSEKYRVEGVFDKEIMVKCNAITLLDKELNSDNKRKPMPQSFIVLGGGVCDTYQPAEKIYELSRKTLQLILKYNYPVHILTKSTLIERDLDIIGEINKNSKAIISFSFSSTDEKLNNIFEPGVPPPKERLKLIKKIKESGIN